MFIQLKMLCLKKQIQKKLLNKFCEEEFYCFYLLKQYTLWVASVISCSWKNEIKKCDWTKHFENALMVFKPCVSKSHCSFKHSNIQSDLWTNLSSEPFTWLQLHRRHPLLTTYSCNNNNLHKVRPNEYEWFIWSTESIAWSHCNKS